jgi:hypothetical protein
MKDEQLEDLKQFINTRIAQSEARFDENLKSEITRRRQEMLESFSGVGDAIDEIVK